jgi:predicted GNAT family N-acyltransferase
MPPNFRGMALMQIEYGSPMYAQMLQLRDEVLRRPLGLSLHAKDCTAEANDMLIGAFEDGKILGCCVLTPLDSETVKLRQMAVAKKQQQKGIGFSIMQFAENLARDRGFRKMTMHARDSATGFYEKMGYRIKGEPFEEVTIPHYVMEKNLR